MTGARPEGGRSGAGSVAVMDALGDAREGSGLLLSLRPGRSPYSWEGAS